MPRTRTKLPTLASTVGTALEWYDFSLYGTASALVLPAVFFPTSDRVVATRSSLAACAIGCFARPVGGVPSGPLGGGLGRRRVAWRSLLRLAAARGASGRTQPLG